MSRPAGHGAPALVTERLGHSTPSPKMTFERAARKLTKWDASFPRNSPPEALKQAAAEDPELARAVVDLLAYRFTAHRPRHMSGRQDYRACTGVAYELLPHLPEAEKHRFLDSVLFFFEYDEAYSEMAHVICDAYSRETLEDAIFNNVESGDDLRARNALLLPRHVFYGRSESHSVTGTFRERLTAAAARLESEDPSVLLRAGLERFALPVPPTLRD